MSDGRETPSMGRVRKGLRAMEEMDLPMDPAFFDRLHDSIMAKVEEAVMEPAPLFLGPRKRLRAHWREWLYPLGGSMALALAVSLVALRMASTSIPGQARLDDGSEALIAAVLNSPEGSSPSLLSSQTEADFFVDVASQSFENLNISQFNKIMGEDRR